MFVRLTPGALCMGESQGEGEIARGRWARSEELCGPLTLESQGAW